MTLEERFWSKVSKSDGCWEWIASVNKAGYGSFGIPGNTGARAHRVSYELANGPIPKGVEVCHACDNKRCVRPSHLFLGTHQDNMSDMANKGRGTKRKGSDHPNAKLTNAQVDEIRQRRARGESLSSIAAQFAISMSHVSEISHGQVRGLPPVAGIDTMRVARGARLPQTKLTEADVIQIRARVAAGERQHSIARDFGMGQSAISDIVNRKRWTHV